MKKKTLTFKITLSYFFGKKSKDNKKKVLLYLFFVQRVQQLKTATTDPREGTEP